MHRKILVVDHHLVLLGSANMTRESLRIHGNLVAGMESPELASYLEGNDTLQSQTFTVGNQDIEMWMLPENRSAVEKIIKMLQGAKKTMHIAMFTWTRQDFVNEVTKAHERGVTTSAVIDYYAGKGSSEKVFQALESHDVPVRLSDGMGLLHHKFAYIDGKTLIQGSANWTKAAFTANEDCFMILHDLTDEQKIVLDNVLKQL